jgi:hypothetical protein
MIIALNPTEKVSQVAQLQCTTDIASLGYDGGMLVTNWDQMTPQAAALTRARQLRAQGHNIPTLDDGYHWTLKDGKLTPARDSTEPGEDGKVPPQLELVPIGDKQWEVRPATNQPPAKRFERNARTADVIQELMGRESTSSFKPYAEMLRQEGLIRGNRDIITLLEGPNSIRFQGRTVDEVRHELKMRFNDRVVQRMTNVSETDMRQRYPDLNWNNPAEALKQAKHQEMMRMTQGLFGADKGKLSERWYEQVYGVNPYRQVALSQAEMKRLGLNFSQDRIVDFVQGNQLREVKAIKDEITPKSRDQKQFNDFIQIAQQEGGVQVPLPDGSTRQVQQVRYVFTDPRGVKANAGWMSKEMKNNPNLSFEVFNWQGERVTLRNEIEVNQWRANLDNWIGQPPAIAN